jgi:ribokinase
LILVIGDLMLDIFLLSELQQEEQATGLLLRGGGSAANTAAWLASEGQSVTFVGCVGADTIGSALVRELEGQGVALAVRRVDGAETGAVVVELQSAERVMRSSRGANMLLSPADIEGIDLPGISAVHITGYTLLCEFGFEMLRAAGRLAASKNALLSFDPASVGVIRSLGRSELGSEMVAAGVDILLPNTLEALELTGSTDVEDAVIQLSGRFPHVVVKDGARGAIHCAGRKAFRVPSTGVTPVDTTGAGDAFNAAVVRALCEGADVRAAVSSGVGLAGFAVSRFGGRPE